MNHVHIDTRTGRVYKLEDLFVKGSDYREVLTEIVREQIRELADSGNMDYFPDSFDGVSDDQQFYLTEKGLNLYFQPYEIASFAAGFPTFMITFDEISDIINRDGEFWKAFN
jgi:hypothetical protein